ncbi:hypothetical protein I4F81_005577 [Pyropia yezoensis]|uniref:Uncharacterized protein n=1 Tax=Pyropia yezoensis TaxID=2788 RepID=A0ACC3BYN5_PYRYE|nr:hypothetical protein I4F81_005577 [Neopyropia yezoensis]
MTLSIDQWVSSVESQLASLTIRMDSLAVDLVTAEEAEPDELPPLLDALDDACDDLLDSLGGVAGSIATLAESAGGEVDSWAEAATARADAAVSAVTSIKERGPVNAVTETAAGGAGCFPRAT